MNVLYTAEATATGDGRSGHVRSSDGIIDTDLAAPAELGGPGGSTNPEQLFAAGYSACFHNALRRVARRAGADVAGSSVTARVGIGPDGPGFGLAVELFVTMPRVAQADAEGLVEKAHAVCPYSRAIHGNIEVSTKVAG